MAGGQRRALTQHRMGEHSGYTFPRTHRLATKAQFQAVYDARVRFSHPAVGVAALPNTLVHCRLGISMAKRVGSAPKRNRIKRLLRESFRLGQHEFPGTYDLLLMVRPHEVMELQAYRQLLQSAVQKLHDNWQKKLREGRSS